MKTCTPQCLPLHLRPVLKQRHVHKKTRIVTKSQLNEVIKDTVKWYGWTMVYNVYNKHALNYLDATLVTTTQLACASLLHITNNSNPVISKPLPQEIPMYVGCIGLLGFGQFLGNHFGNMATSCMSISSVNIIKSSEPLITMVIMYLLFHQKYEIYKISLVFPIVIGIVMCNMSDMTYSNLGALFCTLSNVFHILKIIVAKKYFVDKFGYQGEVLYVLTNLGSLIICVPVLLKTLVYIEPIHGCYLLLSSVGYYYNSVVAFNLISKISPVKFSMLNIYKRLLITIIEYVIALKIPSTITLCGLVLTNTSLYFYLK
jgi:drug/metabolite transporter (DMT)-like permease